MKKIMISMVMIVFITSSLFAQVPISGYNSSAKRINHDCLRDQSTGISKPDFLKNISVVNPVNEAICINAGENENITKVEVYDFNGSLLIAENTNNNTVHIPAENLNSGTYFLRIYNDAGFVTKRICKI
jgi:hypothetical protein